MTNVRQWFQELTASELAAVQHYKRESYLPESRALLTTELEQRKLDCKTVELLVASVRFNKGNTGCSRCNSLKQIPNGHCTICGWTEADEVERTKPWYVKVLEALSIFGH